MLSSCLRRAGQSQRLTVFIFFDFDLPVLSDVRSKVEMYLMNIEKKFSTPLEHKQYSYTIFDFE